MKIAYIGLRGVPANYSGIEKAVEEIASRLSGNNHLTVYCMGSRFPKNNRKDIHKGIHLKYIPNLPGKNFEMISYAFFSTLRACFSSAQIIHFHAIGPSSFAILARLFGKKVVSTNHGLDWRRSKWSKFAKAYLLFGEYVSAKFTHTTISVSRYVKKYYKDKYNTDVKYIPNGKDKNILIDHNAPKKYNLEKDRYILYVGRVTQEKGLKCLCAAFKACELEGYKLVIVGGSIDTFKQELESQFSDPNIIFTGPIYDRNALAGLYANSKVFVLPSEIEGQSIVVLEALSYGCTVLVSDIPENTDLLDKYGYTFKLNDVMDLSGKLTSIVNTQNKIVYEDISTYLEDYDWDKIASRTEQVYRDVLL